MPLLQPGGVVIPATAGVYGQLVQSPMLASQCCHLQQPLLTEPFKAQNREAEHVAEAADESALQAALESAIQQRNAASGMNGLQMHAMHVGPLYPDHLELLSEPFEVFRFDFGQPPEGSQSQKLQVTLHCPACLNAMLNVCALPLQSKQHLAVSQEHRQNWRYQRNAQLQCCSVFKGNMA